jgi:hypothetical protein
VKRGDPEINIPGIPELREQIALAHVDADQLLVLAL